MAFEKKEGQGALFKNAKKAQPNHPDYRGDCLINGQECWISAWIKDGKQGKYMSLAIAPKDAPAPKAEQQKQDEDDGIPF